MAVNLEEVAQTYIQPNVSQQPSEPDSPLLKSGVNSNMDVQSPCIEMNGRFLTALVGQETDLTSEPTSIAGYRTAIAQGVRMYPLVKAHCLVS